MLRMKINKLKKCETSKSQSSKELFNNKDASQITTAKEPYDGKGENVCVILIDVKHRYI